MPSFKDNAIIPEKDHKIVNLAGTHLTKHLNGYLLAPIDAKRKNNEPKIEHGTNGTECKLDGLVHSRWKRLFS